MNLYSVHCETFCIIALFVSFMQKVHSLFRSVNDLIFRRVLGQLVLSFVQTADVIELLSQPRKNAPRFCLRLQMPLRLLLAHQVC